MLQFSLGTKRPDLERSRSQPSHIRYTCLHHAITSKTVLRSCLLLLLLLPDGGFPALMLAHLSNRRSFIHSTDLLLLPHHADCT